MTKLDVDQSEFGQIRSWPFFRAPSRHLFFFIKSSSVIRNSFKHFISEHPSTFFNGSHKNKTNKNMSCCCLDVGVLPTLPFLLSKEKNHWVEWLSEIATAQQGRFSEVGIKKLQNEIYLHGNICFTGKHTFRNLEVMDTNLLISKAFL